MVPLSIPVKTIDQNVTHATAGHGHTAFIKNDASLWTVGQNDSGQLGDNTTTNRSTPIKVVDGNVTQVVAGLSHTMFIKNDGSLWGMGSGGAGRIGNGSSSPISTPLIYLKWHDHTLFIKWFTLGDG